MKTDQIHWFMGGSLFVPIDGFNGQRLIDVQNYLDFMSQHVTDLSAWHLSFRELAQELPVAEVTP